MDEGGLDVEHSFFTVYKERVKIRSMVNERTGVLSENKIIMTWYIMDMYRDELGNHKSISI